MSTMDKMRVGRRRRAWGRRRSWQRWTRSGQIEGSRKEKNCMNRDRGQGFGATVRCWTRWRSMRDLGQAAGAESPGPLRRARTVSRREKRLCSRDLTSQRVTRGDPGWSAGSRMGELRGRNGAKTADHRRMRTTARSEVLRLEEGRESGRSRAPTIGCRGEGRRARAGIDPLKWKRVDLKEMEVMMQFRGWRGSAPSREGTSRM